jgi:hypothetical protein
VCRLVARAEQVADLIERETDPLRGVDDRQAPANTSSL